MKLKDIENDACAGFTYLDRYVNDGSPSGFTEINKTSPLTDPFGFVKNFNLLSIESSVENFRIYGSLKDNIPLSEGQFYIHPDMENHIHLTGCKIIKEDKFRVSPTSSFRTVKIETGHSGDFIKLHYDKVIGRVFRRLNTKKAISGVEISAIVREGLEKGILADNISILEEPFAKIFKNPYVLNENDYWGMVWRNAKPFGRQANNIQYIIPLFSFWSKDRINSKEEIFGKQILGKWTNNAREKFISGILIPLLDTYFDLLVNLGLQNEYNAQNLLIGFDKDWNAVSVIMRDMMGIEKDLALRAMLGFSVVFDSTPYKVLSIDDPLYKIRHSFAFDFKVCQYVLEPLIALCVDLGLTVRQELIELLRERTRYWCLHLPDDFFPKGKWYSHDKIDISVKENRKYVENRNPLLRD